MSCKNKEQQPTDIQASTKDAFLIKDQDSISIDSDGKRNLAEEDLESIFYSDLRPKQKLRKGIIYIDTVKFISYDPIGDYSGITVSKNNKEVYLLNSKEDESLNKGDTLVIEWQVVTNCTLDNASDKWLDIELIKQIKKQ